MSYLDPQKFKNASPGQFPFSISMLSWALNEEENVLDFLERSRELMNSLGADYEHVFIDDGSTDKTYELALQFQKEYPQLKLIRNPRNRGSGWNMRIAVNHACKDVLFWQTVDWSYDILRLKSHLKHLEKYDVVQGVRVTLKRPQYANLFSKIPYFKYIKVKRRSDNLWKAIISVTNFLMIRTLFRVPLLDFQNVTIYPTRLLQSLELEAYSSFTNAEMLLKAYWRGVSIKQVPIDFIPRTRGVANGTRWRAILSSVKQILYYWIKWQVLRMKPDKNRGTIFPPEQVESEGYAQSKLLAYEEQLTSFDRPS